MRQLNIQSEKDLGRIVLTQNQQDFFKDPAFAKAELNKNQYCWLVARQYHWFIFIFIYVFIN